MSNIEKNKIRIMSFISALLIYGVFIGVNFDPNVTEVQAKILLNPPFGISVRRFFITLNAVIFFPIFFVAKHFVKIASYALEQGKGIRAISLIIFLFSIGKNNPLDIRKSKNIVICSLIYFCS